MTFNEHLIKHDWQKEYVNRPYYQEIQRQIPDVEYDRDFRSAYELGQHLHNERGGTTSFEESEKDLKVKWESLKAESWLKWEHAKHAVKDAWDEM